MAERRGSNFLNWFMQVQVLSGVYMRVLNKVGLGLGFRVTASEAWQLVQMMTAKSVNNEDQIVDLQYKNVLLSGARLRHFINNLICPDTYFTFR